MDSKNQKGQILIEIAIIMAFIVLVIFGALVQLTKIKDRHQQYQFSTGVNHGKMAPIQNRN
ncbi:MAG: hypothetical protein J7501_09995 [Bdellovibrio sp.]|nr:hypothetical protein [Bdellovibrio sp.]